MTSGHAPALYDPDWLSLLDARERLKARGAEANEAEMGPLPCAARQEAQGSHLQSRR